MRISLPHFHIIVKKLLKYLVHGNETSKGADRIIEKLNFIIEGYGVEAIIGNDVADDEYWDDTVAVYINMGDTYAKTILYDVHESEFVVTTWGDWVEEHQEKYDIK